MTLPTPENDTALTGTEPSTPTATLSSEPTPVAPPPQPQSAPTLPEDTPAGDAQLLAYQRAYLLQQVMDAPEHQLAKGKANRFPRATARELSLNPGLANDLRENLVEEGHLATLRKSGSIVYELTQSGKALLATLPQKPLPEGRKPQREGPVSNEEQLARKTFLLFQLFEAPNQTLDQKEANRFREPGRKFLGLKAGTANRIRREMADQGLIDMQKDGRNATYRLTPAGIEFLGARSSFPLAEFTVQGKVLNDLLEAARESARQFEQTPAEPVETEVSAPPEALTSTEEPATVS